MPDTATRARPTTIGVALVALALALIAGACGGEGGAEEAAPSTTTTSSTTTTTTTTEPPAPVEPLTGMPLADEALLDTPALVVKIGNNDRKSLPQTGLNEADIVYEELVEGLKTRFAAVFHADVPPRVGPVRSGRTSDLDIVADLGRPAFAFSGGNPGTVGALRAAVDDGRIWAESFDVGNDAYSRDRSRSAPDNVFLDTALYASMYQGEPEGPSQIFLYRDEGDDPPEGDEGGGVAVAYPRSYGRTMAHVWDEAVGGWVRIQDGELHTTLDAAGGLVEIAPQNVVVLDAEYRTSPADPASPEASSFGAGRAWVLTDGRVVEGRAREAGPGRDAQGRRHHGRRRPRAGQDRRGRRRRRRHGPRAGAVRHPPRRRRGPHERPRDDRGHQGAVTIPVMAKARIGHFVEAQILEALGVDYVDESEVLTPADEAHHIDKWAFTVPFVCGATNLGEALRRISEGACMIRSKGEAGTGNIVEAVRHLRSILGDIRKITQADSAELFDWAKRLQAPLPLVQEVAETGELPVPLFCAGGIATPADAALAMQLGAEAVFVGSGIFKSDDPPAGPRPSSRPPPTSATPTSWPRSAAASARPCPASRSARSRPSSPTGAGDAAAPSRPPR
jgi:hypothetical protein